MKKVNCPKKICRNPGAATTEGGIIGLGDTFSMTIRIPKKMAEIVKRADLLLSKVGLPSVVPRTNEVAEIKKAPRPKKSKLHKPNPGSATRLFESCGSCQ
jgi:hypothetical protein